MLFRSPPKEEQREEVPPTPETPAEGRTEPREQPKAAGQEEPQAPSSPPPTDAEKRKREAEEIARTIEQLEGLRCYCEGMAESDESGSHVWALDVDALEFAISRLKQ